MSSSTVKYIFQNSKTFRLPLSYLHMLTMAMEGRLHLCWVGWNSNQATLSCLGPSRAVSSGPLLLQLHQHIIWTNYTQCFSSFRRFISSQQLQLLQWKMLYPFTFHLAVAVTLSVGAPLHYTKQGCSWTLSKECSLRCWLTLARELVSCTSQIPSMAGWQCRPKPPSTLQLHQLC